MRLLYLSFSPISESRQAPQILTISQGSTSKHGCSSESPEEPCLKSVDSSVLASAVLTDIAGLRGGLESYKLFSPTQAGRSAGASEFSLTCDPDFSCPNPKTVSHAASPEKDHSIKCKPLRTGSLQCTLTPFTCEISINKQQQLCV